MNHVIFVFDGLIDVPDRFQLSVLVGRELLEELAFLDGEDSGLHETFNGVGQAPIDVAVRRLDAALQFLLGEVNHLVLQLQVVVVLLVGLDNR